ncbi:MAG TPA: HPF/RaiA family ribosome-associated protein [Stellaceae bacterium]|jgi:ribosome-associated translation inhibitor RaiA|nr:HPF/RaiA family ribosome-associated protein [Stellaceae bacterium]
MTVPLQITFRDLPHSSAVETQIRERAENLQRVFDRLTACRVIVEGRHRPQRAGRVAHLCIELSVPGRTITIGRGAAELESHDDVFVAVRAAFDAARRRLDRHAQRRRGEVKTHSQAEPEPAA